MKWKGLRVALIGPLAPPAGGMANQVRQISDCMRAEGAEVHIIQTNTPLRPQWLQRLVYVRSVIRLIPYLATLWRMTAKVEVFHVFASSGWAWHLLAAPAVWVAKLRGVPCLVHYHGGEARAFFSRSVRQVRPTINAADAVVVPSTFLKDIFAEFDIQARIIPNVVDLLLFRPRADPGLQSPHVVVARNLEAIYDIPTALHAFRAIRAEIPSARLSIAGSGPERSKLERIAQELAIADATTFTGTLDKTAMAELYRSASVVLNPALADNSPVSIIEALASGVPVVTARVGGIPMLVKDGISALLVEAGNASGMADAALRLLRDPDLCAAMVRQGLVEAQHYAWARVGDVWLDAYAGAIGKTFVSARLV